MEPNKPQGSFGSLGCTLCKGETLKSEKHCRTQMDIPFSTPHIGVTMSLSRSKHLRSILSTTDWRLAMTSPTPPSSKVIWRSLVRLVPRTTQLMSLCKSVIILKKASSIVHYNAMLKRMSSHRTTDWFHSKAVFSFSFSFFLYRSNCVICLCPDKKTVLQEAHRVLKVRTLDNFYSSTVI